MLDASLSPCRRYHPTGVPSRFSREDLAHLRDVENILRWVAISQTVQIDPRRMGLRLVRRGGALLGEEVIENVTGVGTSAHPRPCGLRHDYGQSPGARPPMEFSHGQMSTKARRIMVRSVTMMIYWGGIPAPGPCRSSHVG